MVIKARIAQGFGPDIYTSTNGTREDDEMEWIEFSKSLPPNRVLVAAKNQAGNVMTDLTSKWGQLYGQDGARVTGLVFTEWILMDDYETEKPSRRTKAPESRMGVHDSAEATVERSKHGNRE